VVSGPSALALGMDSMECLREIGRTTSEGSCKPSWSICIYICAFWPEIANNKKRHNHNNKPHRLPASRTIPLPLSQEMKTTQNIRQKIQKRSGASKRRATHTNSNHPPHIHGRLPQHSLQVPTALCRLLRHGALDQVSAAVGGDLARYPDLSAGFYGLGVGTCCCGGC
jgi:hypothetical protein